MTEDPYVHALDTFAFESKNFCSFCFGPATAKCLKCQATVYCDRRCQSSDWPEHKAECKAFRDLTVRCAALIRKNSLLDIFQFVRLIGRCVSKIQNTEIFNEIQNAENFGKIQNTENFNEIQNAENFSKIQNAENFDRIQNKNNETEVTQFFGLKWWFWNLSLFH